MRRPFGGLYGRAPMQTRVETDLQGAGAQLNGKMIYQAEPQRQLSGPKAAEAEDADAPASGKESRVKSTQAA